VGQHRYRLPGVAVPGNWMVTGRARQIRKRISCGLRPTTYHPMWSVPKSLACRNKIYVKKWSKHKMLNLSTG